MLIKLLRAMFIAAVVAGVEAQTAEQYVAVLVPTYAGEPTAGAYGSLWQTEVWVHNSGPEPVWVDSSTRENPCRLAACPLTFVEPDETRGRSVRVGLGSGGGFLYVDRQYIDNIHMSVRVLELSRDPADTGITIPAVVRGAIEPGRPARIVHVPVKDAQARSLLRIYDLETRGAPVTLRLTNESTGAVVHESLWAMKAWQGSDDIPESAFSDGLPTYAEVRLEDLGLPDVAHVRLEIHPHDPASRVWAMLSWTDVVTQRVSLLYPQP